MSNFKISSDLLIEKQELNRLKRFIVDDGHKAELLLHTKSFGIVKGAKLLNGDFIEDKDSFKIENIGANSNAVNVLPGRAINKYGEVITLLDSKTLPIPNNGLWYWVKIAYRTITTERGTVSIDINGNLTGVDTKFTEILRGQPNFPTKIKFEDSTLGNTYEYEVVEVIDDETAVLSGSFVNEPDLKYSVIGTFTPGYIVPNADKEIYEYDDVLVSLVQENPSNPGVPPVNDLDEEFYLARLKTNGLNVLIEDKRVEFWTTKEAYFTTLISRIANPIIGVESVKWDITTTPRDRNEVNVVWGFRTKNWSLDTTQNKITINSGLGGILKENVLTNYVNGSFDGWRLYTKSGIYYRVVSSNKSGSQLNIILDFMDPNNFALSDELWIVPDVEEIEIQANYNNAVGVNMVLTEKFLFPIHIGEGKVYLRIVDSKLPYKYNLKFRYKNNFEYSDWLKFPDDPVGHYSEKSFDDNGIIKVLPADREQKPYVASLTDGFVEIVPHPLNFNILFEQVITGDKFGVDHKNLENSTLLYDLVVGRDRQMQVFHANNLTVNNDMLINLNKTRHDGTPCINGNRFIVQIVGDLKLNLRNVKVITDYTNPATYQVVRDITEQDTVFIRQNQFKQKSGLVMIFSYDGTDWILSISNEMNGLPKNSIIQYGGPLSNFDSTGLGITDEVHGFALCNGNYGTVDMRSRVGIMFNASDSDHSVVNGIGGSKNIYLSKNQLPAYTLNSSSISHYHRVTGRRASRNTSGSGYAINQVHIGGPNLSNSAITNTTSEVSNVTVTSGGGNQPVNVMQPFKNIILIQKII